MKYSETYRHSAGIFATTCGLLGAAAVLASVVRVEVRPVVLLAGWMPVWVGVALVGAVVAAAAGRWVAQALCMVVCVLGAWLLAPLYVPDSATVEGPTLTVMQANVKRGQADPALLVQTVRERNVDVLTVQELTDETVDGVAAAGMGDLLPHRIEISHGPSGLGGGIYSRFPLSNVRELDGFLSSNIVADVDVGLGEPVAVLAVHPAPAYLFPAPMWASELRALGTEFDTLSDRDNVIAVGDFNASWPQRQYRDLLTDGYTDAADQVGAGLLPTMPAHRWYPAVTGIDRIVTKGATVSELERITIAGSDHHGLVAVVGGGGGGGGGGAPTPPPPPPHSAPTPTTARGGPPSAR
ncbi:endonuclease/exonuclease/phosphatase family protein, partial [Rhodococcus sp. NPDC003318]|uniref:endonuclease/exonuclease/phosphatase family protein n=1 Tax=Rhodococcus sp. NPDC003318 TaxID=3364503 RepID=UPI0036BAD46E